MVDRVENIKILYDSVVEGDVPNSFIIKKFGANNAINTSMSAVCDGGVYRMPTTPTNLELVTDSEDDNISGTGIRKIGIWGIGPNWSPAYIEVIPTGTTPALINVPLRRVHQMRALQAGVYGNVEIPSHQSTVTLREVGGGDVWATIPMISVSYGLGTAEIGAYSVPHGWQASILAKTFTIEANKAPNLGLFVRENADLINAPFETFISVSFKRNLDNDMHIPKSVLEGPFTGPCDLVFMGYTDLGTAKVQIDFDIYLKKVT